MEMSNREHEGLFDELVQTCSCCEENRAGGIWRVSASDRDMVPTMCSIVALKDDLDVWMRGISDGWNTVSRNARVVMWKRAVFHVW
jgi:hypothetical protein